MKRFISAVFAFDWAQIFYYVGVLAPFGIGVIVGIFAVAKLIEFLYGDEVPSNLSHNEIKKYFVNFV